MRKALLVMVLVMFLFVVLEADFSYAKGKYCGNCVLSKVVLGAKKIGAAVDNKVKDGYVAAKKKLTCKKDKVWVKGHVMVVKKGKKTCKIWVKGHWRKINKKGKK